MSEPIVAFCDWYFRLVANMPESLIDLFFFLSIVIASFAISIVVCSLSYIIYSIVAGGGRHYERH